MTLQRLIPAALRPQRRGTSGRGGFTLIELLVVIAVILILAALVMPLLSRSIAHARGVKCVSNLKQIGAALMNYLKDNGMRFQKSWSAMSADPSEREDWTTVTLPYGPDPGIFRCPARQPYPYTLYGNPTRGISFPLNYGISYGIQDEIWSRIEDPSKIGVVADAGHDRFYSNEGTWGLPQIRKCREHRNRAGLLFADWHAELVKDVTTDMFMP